MPNRLFHVEKRRSVRANTDLLAAGKCGKASLKSSYPTVMMSIHHEYRSFQICDVCVWSIKIYRYTEQDWRIYKLHWISFLGITLKNSEVPQIRKHSLNVEIFQVISSACCLFFFLVVICLSLNQSLILSIPFDRLISSLLSQFLRVMPFICRTICFHVVSNIVDMGVFTVLYRHNFVSSCVSPYCVYLK